MENFSPVPSPSKRRRWPKFLTSSWFIVLSTLVLLAIWIALSLQSFSDSLSSMGRADSTQAELTYEYYKGDESSEVKVARLELTGPISNTSTQANTFFFTAPDLIYGKEVAHKLDKLAKDKDIKAVLIDLTTPGGEITASDAIAEGILAYQNKTGQKVYVFVSELSASGGVWASAPASTIIANPTAIVGSVGVAGGYAPKFTNISSYSEGLLGLSVNANINFTPIYRGKCKQPDNQLNLSEEYIRDCINPELEAMYSAFVNHISKYNQLSPEVIRNELGARVFLANSREATKYGFVDKVGNEDFVIQLISQDLNQTNPVQILDVVDYSGGLLEQFLGPIFYNSRSKTSLSQASFCQTNTPLLVYGDIRQIRKSICQE